jgi:hypothetical protein
MPATAVPAFLDALVAALQARGGLAGVSVYSCPVSPEDLGKEAIELAAETDIEQTVAAMNSTHIEESFDVKGSIICFAPMPAGVTKVATINAAAKKVRDRACAILGEVESELSTNDTVTATVRDAHTTGIKVSQGLAPEGQLGRWCAIEFTISAEAHTTP